MLEIDLRNQLSAKFVDQLYRSLLPQRRYQSLEHPGSASKQSEVTFDLLHDAGSTHLHGDVGAVTQLRTMQLGHRGSSKWLALEFGKQVLDRLTKGSLDRLNGYVRIERRNMVLEVFQLLAIAGR